MAGESSLTTGDYGDDSALSRLKRLRVRYLQAPDAAQAQVFAKRNSGEMPKTGKAGQMRDGKFAEDWYMLDIAGSMQQMGLMPPLSIGKTRVGQAMLWGAVNAKLVAGAIGGAALGGWVLRRSLRG